MTQCVHGCVNSNRYETGDLLCAAGVVSGHDITFEAAMTKMMFLFGLGFGPVAVKKYLQTSLRGEITI